MPKLAIIACLFSILFLILIGGCSNNVSDIRHGEYFDPIFKKFNDAKLSDKKEVLAYLDSAFHSFPIPSPRDIYSYDSIKGHWVGYVTGDYKQSFAYVDSMIMVSKPRAEVGNVYGSMYSDALYEKGYRLKGIKKYDEAFQCYQLAHQIELQYKTDKCKQSTFNGYVGDLMFARERYIPAISYFRKAYDELRLPCTANANSLLRTKTILTNNIGLSYLRVGLLDSADFYQRKALNFIKSKSSLAGFEESDQWVFVINADQGEVLSRQGKYAEAEALLKKSIDGTINTGRGYAQLTQARLAELYFKADKNDLLKNTLSELKQSLDSLDGEDQRMKWLSLKSRYFELRKQIDSAFSYRKKFDDQQEIIEKRDREFASLDISSAIENAELKNFNEGLQRSGKLKSWFLVVAILVLIMAGAIALLIWYNLKRTRKLNIQVQQKNNELERAFNALEQTYAENIRIMRVVAHDLKNPISAIQNIMHGLLQKEQPGNDKEMFQAIQSSCGNSLMLIHDLLEERKEQVKKAQQLIDIGNVLENCVQLLQAKADEKGQRLRLFSNHVDVSANRQKIWRVMSNLITNAIKFSPNKSSIDIKLQQKNNVVLFSVKDSGIGIPEHLKEKIFDMSGDARRAGTEGEQSHGLGLSISKRIVEEHEGRLWFESKEHEGSVFYFEIPISA